MSYLGAIVRLSFLEFVDFDHASEDDNSRQVPVFLHNVDVVANIDAEVDELVSMV